MITRATLLITAALFSLLPLEVKADELDLIRQRWEGEQASAACIGRVKYQEQLESLMRMLPIDAPDELEKWGHLSAARGDSQVVFDEVFRRRLLTAAVNSKTSESLLAVLTRCPPGEMHYTLVERFIVESNGVDALDALFTAADKAEAPWVSNRLFAFIRRAFPGIAARLGPNNTNLTRECRAWIAARKGKLRLVESYGTMNPATSGMRSTQKVLEDCALLTEARDTR
ncbi:hypothetical protein [Verrucomicrobium sp. BvORR034]|uniref:hypothetical protein n=1 Tax=Verrucomicrobium sp. BvORR034 TaxID=1396418 RepID=UPI000679AD20|nr:hypothetical protein [Verrucomicrobium sp. BvORR034]